MDTKPRRVMILGLDGATMDLIRPWAEAGILPTFQKLMREGAWGMLRSTQPPLTPMAWSSAFTGKNPGKHGVFDFTTRKQASYDYVFVNSHVRQAPSIWQLASQAGKRVIVYNVPLTYPPERVNGVMVSGLTTPPGAKDASYPPELQQELEQAIPGLSISGHGVFRPGQEVEYVLELLEINDQNLRAARYLMERQPWDLFVMVFQNTDAVEHFMWNHMEDQGAGLPEPAREVAANAIQQIYRDVDAKLAQLIQEAGEGTQVLVMSDHGHGRLEYGFSVNNWLLKKGYIKFKRDALTQVKYLLYRLGFTPALALRLMSKLPRRKKIRGTGSHRLTSAKQMLNRRLFLSFDDIDWSRTRAYSNGYCGPIFVNLKGREPNGIVAPGREYDALLDQLSADLATVKEPGTNAPLFPEVHRGHEVYSGPFAERGPDLVFYPKNWKFNAAGRRQFETNRWLVPMGDKTDKTHSLIQMRVAYTGTHRMDGILFLSGPGVRQGFEMSNSSIMDIAPTALALLDVPVPQDMDGRVLEAALTPDLRERLGVSYTSGDGLKPDLPPVEELSPEDEEILVARLRNLGYIG